MNKLQTIRRIISENLMIAPESIQADAQITGLENINSLAFEMVVVAMEKERGRPIEPAELIPVKTVDDLAQLLQ
jgi:acyl carrier protein